MDWDVIGKAMTIDAGELPTGHAVFDAPQSIACASCGQCCKGLPGQFYPADLGTTVDERREKARLLLATGLYSIDWWEGDVVEPNEMTVITHLRPATLKGRGNIFDASWGGQCVMLSDNGCTLAREDRPTVCKALVPRKGEEDCHGLSRRDLAIAWRADSYWLDALGQEMSAE